MTKLQGLGLAASLLLVLGTLSPLARGEATQRAGVLVAVDGSLSPKRLPRKAQVPVSVSIDGQIKALGGAAAPPQLQKLQVAINGTGKLDVDGIPRCRIGHISPSTSSEALDACRDALVGEGSFSADVVLPEQSPFPSRGRLLAFNGTIGGRPALLAHVYGTEPIPTSYVFAFRIKRQRGTFGTVLETSFPKATGDWGYVTGIELNLGRRFLTASCPAPDGFTKAVFPLVKTSLQFKGGLNLQSTLVRGCTVKE